MVKGAEIPEKLFLGQALVWPEREVDGVLKPEYNTGDGAFELAAPIYARVKGQPELVKKQYLDMNMWLPGDILLKADKMCMAHSLELRVPFLDRDVFEAVRTLPPEAKFAHGKTKYLFRKVARKYIPEDTAARKKLGFPVPVRVWLRDDDWYGRVKKMFQSPISRQYFHTEKLTALLEEHHAGKKDNSRKIWTVLAFLFWYQEYFDE